MKAGCIVELKRLRGFNLGGWFSQIDAIREKDPEGFPGIEKHMEQFITREDFLRQKAWGFNHVRLPVDSLNFFNESSDTPIENRLRVLDRAI
jgi:aryl-phospho-beta-D-glucosidase BglC (GH1 family)